MIEEWAVYQKHACDFLFCFGRFNKSIQLTDDILYDFSYFRWISQSHAQELLKIDRIIWIEPGKIVHFTFIDALNPGLTLPINSIDGENDINYGNDWNCILNFQSLP